MESLVKAPHAKSHCFAGAFAGKRVLVTGHTGFKGSWLVEWLLALGAEVTGLALPPPTEPSLFDQLDLTGRITDLRGDIRDLTLVQKALATAAPDFVFHLAAQPLVLLSYEQPLETFATNVMGTVNLLEAVRLAGKPCAVVVVTTDKCYENTGQRHGYREEDPMGGHDPYSASKGAAELVAAAYRRSYFSAPDSSVKIASGRSGNVIGGGDWARDRIVPDCIRSLQCGEAIPVRNRHATRPWQHVLEPLSGYLWLAARLPVGNALAEALDSAFNFGPWAETNHTVRVLVEEILKHWPGSWEDRTVPGAVHEAAMLSLATDKAQRLLGWQPAWDFAKTIAHTVDWYRLISKDATRAAACTRQHIEDYTASARALNLSWSHE